MAWSADVTWSSAGSSTPGGTGNWNGGSTWWNGSSAVTWTAGDNATFSAAGNTTVNSNVTAGNLTFSSGTANISILDGAGSLTVNNGITATNTANTAARTFTISESSLILGANQTWTVNNGGSTGTANLAVSSAVSGSGLGITKAGNGTLTLSGANTYSGPTTISAGTLQIGAGAASGSVSGNITNNADLVFNRSDAVTWSNAISGTGNLTKASGSGTLTLSGANTFNGAVTVASGTLSVNSISDSVASALGNGSSLTLGQTTRFSYTGGTATTSRSLILTGSSGSIQFQASGSGPLTWSGNITNQLTSSGDIDFRGSSTANNTFSGVISNNGSNTLRVIKNETGKWIFSGNNTFTSNLDMFDGTLSVATIGNSTQASNAGAGSLIRFGGWTGTNPILEYTGAGNTSNKQFKLGGGGTANTGAIILNNGTGALVFNNSAFNVSGDALPASSARTLTLGGSNTNNNTISGVIINNNSTNTVSVNKTGTGLWILSGNNTYTDGTTVSAGTLQIGHANALGTTGNITFGGGTLQYGSGITADLSSRIKNSGSAMAIDTNGQSVTYASVLDSSNSGGLTKNGSGTLTLNASNTYTGATTINAGTLQISNANATSSGNITFGGGTLQYGSGITADISSRLKNSASAMVIDTNGNTVAFSSVVDSTNSGGLTKNGTGTLTLSANNTYTGTTTVNAGTLALGANLALQNSVLDTSGAGNVTLASGITTPTLGGLSGSKDLSSVITGNYNLVTALTLNPGASQTATYSGNITNGAAGMSLTKSGAGTQVLSGSNNSYSGATIINAGTLAISSNISSSAITLNTGGTISAGTSAAVGSFNAASMTIGTGTGYAFTIGNVNASVAGTDYDQITLTGALTLNNTSGSPLTVSLFGTPTGWTNNGTYSWNIITAASITGFSASNFVTDFTNFGITAGNRTGSWSFSSTAGNITLTYAAPGSISTWSGGAGNWTTGFDSTPVNNAGLSFTGGAGGVSTNNIASGNLTSVANITFVSGAGAYTLNATTGAAGLAGGTPLTVTGAIINNSASSQTINLALSMNSTVSVDATSGNITVGGAISGTGGITKTGSNTLTLSGNNTYSGATTISAGTLSLTGALTGNTAISVGGTSVLSQSAAGSIGGSSSLTHTSTGTSILAGNNTYSGATTISAGTLSLTGALTGNTAISVGGTSVLSQSATGSIGGSSSLTHTSTGTSILAGNNTYSGATTISAGTLQIGAGSTSGSVSGNIINNADLVFNRSDAVTWSNAISGTGNLTKASGSGTLTLSGNNTFTGGVTVASGTLSVNSISNSAASALGNGSSLTLGQGTSLTYTGATANTSRSLILTGSTGSMNISANGTGPLTWSGNVINQLTATASGNYINFAFQGNSTANNTFSGIFSDTSNSQTTNVVKSGTGKWIFSGNNTFTGAADIFDGTLAVGTIGNSTEASNLGAGSTIRFHGSTVGTLEYTGAGNASNKQFRLGGGGTGNGGGIILNNGTGALVFNNSIFNLEGHGAYSNTTREFQLGGSNTNNNTISGSIVNNNATISNFVSVNKTGTGLWILSGNNTYTGGTTVSAGTLQIGHANALGTTGNITFGGGTLQYGSGITADLSSRIKNSASAMAIDTNGQSVTYASVLDSSNSGGLTKNGIGTLTLNASNTYTGTTTINAGTLALGASNIISSNSNVTISGGTMDMGGYNDTVGAITITSGNLTGTGTLTGPSYTLQGGTVGANLGTGTLNATAGTTALNGTAGATTIALNGGNLTLGSANRLGSGANLTLTSGTLTLGGAETVNALTMAGGNLAGSGNTFTAGTYTLQGGTVGANLGTGTLNATAGTTALNGTAAATTIALNGGNLTLGSANRLGSGANLTLTSGTLTLGGNEAVNRLTLAGGTLAGSGTFNATADYDVQSGNISASLGGAAGLGKTGAGTVVLSGNNTYTGTTTVSAGTLRLGASNILSDSSNLTVSGGTFDIGAFNETVNVLTMTNGTLLGTTGVLTGANYNITGGTVNAILGGGTIIVGNGTTNIAQIGSTTSLTVNGSSAIAALTANVVASSVSVQNGGSITGAFSLNASGGISANRGSIASNLIGSGGLTMNGAGNTLTLTGSNTYTGATTLSAGTLSINAAAAVAGTSGVNLANGTVFLYTGAAGNLTRAISVTSGTGTIQNSGSGLLTLSGGLSKNGTTMVLKGGINGITVNGAITGTAANSDLILDGGSITLASANTYNGPTYLLNGTTLTASVANALPTANGRTAVTMDATGSGSSTLALGASQSVASLTGAASSNVTLGSNTLTIGTTSSNTTFAGRISGSGNLVKDGASTQVLSGANTFTGTTTVSSGTLRAGAANALGGTTQIVVNNGGSLLVTADGSVNNSAAVTLAGGSLAFSGTVNETFGALTLSANSTLDFGTESVVAIFSSLVMNGYTLSVTNWTGTTLWNGGTGNNTDQFYVRSTVGPSDLSRISFYSGISNSSFVGTAYQLSSGSFYQEIIPVPEPETYATAAILLLLGTAYQLHRQRKNKTLKANSLHAQV